MGLTSEVPESPDGDLVQVAYAANPVEGAMVGGLLESRGIPCLLQPTGIDGPSLGQALLPKSPQQVMVRPGDAEEARRVLAETMLEEAPEDSDLANARNLRSSEGPAWWRSSPAGAYGAAMLFSLAIVAAAFGLFILVRVL